MSNSADQTDTSQALAESEPGTLASFLSVRTDHELSELQAIRQAKADTLRARGEEPYPTQTTRDTTVAQARERFAEVEPTLEEGAKDDAKLVLAGRIVARRHQEQDRVRAASGWLRRDSTLHAAG